ncbi:28S ribosomal protein S5 mitochondrial [Clonorchis sinensis]|uniref:Small ribosomal subunit protein uS5m n=1 Tax=Clonorchis sinensis TaxID=79923 RepID=G7YI70_CLOSI|nr:28S ribosomal protein S5 mitochondrial [Clonorchis sinensis]
MTEAVGIVEHPSANEIEGVELASVWTTYLDIFIVFEQEEKAQVILDELTKVVLHFTSTNCKVTLLDMQFEHATYNPGRGHLLYEYQILDPTAQPAACAIENPKILDLRFTELLLHSVLSARQAWPSVSVCVQHVPLPVFWQPTEVMSHTSRRLKKLGEHIYPVRLAVILDHQLFVTFDRKLEGCIHYIGAIINQATKSFQETPVELRLVRSEIWNLENRISLNSSIKVTLNNLANYSSRHSRRRPPGNGTTSVLAGLDQNHNSVLRLHRRAISSAVSDVAAPSLESHDIEVLLTTTQFTEAVEYLAVPDSICTPRALTVIQGEMNEAYFQRLEKVRNQSAVKKKRIKLPPLLRGWTGSRLEGQSVGPPTPEHPDFDTRVIEMKVVATMTATIGRYRRFSVLVATGNGRGLCGIGKAKAITLMAAIKRAKQRAAKSLLSFELKDNRTLWHIGHVREWHSSIFAKPAAEGSGLVCHRLLRTLCQIIGIKDMYAKVEGSARNYQVLTRGFLRLLSEQQNYSDLANRVGLHVVAFSQDEDMYPRVLASPDPGCSVDPNTPALSANIVTKSDTPIDNDEPLSILAISHPERRRPRRPPVEHHESFLDDLINVGEGPAIATEMRELVASGERDLNVLALGGRVPLIKGKKKPFYWNLPGNLKVAAIKHRYRNQQEARRQREVYAALDQLNR